MADIKLVACVLLMFGLSAISPIEGHGKMTNPPGRNALWRYPEYAWANPTHDPDDDELVCGGTQTTTDYIGKCGVCGDSILDPTPRRHEIGGQHERGIIVRNYNAGETITVDIYKRVAHGGWFEFRLCEYSRTGQETEECFNQHLLRYADGSTRQWAPDSQEGVYRVTLPAGVRCDRCILQWQWFGEGSNQYYANCADIKIN